MDKPYLIENNLYNNLLQTAILSEVPHGGAKHNARATSLCPCSKHSDLGAIAYCIIRTATYDDHMLP